MRLVDAESWRNETMGGYFPSAKGMHNLEEMPGKSRTDQNTSPFFAYHRGVGALSILAPATLQSNSPQPQLYGGADPSSSAPPGFLGGGARINGRHQPSHCISCTPLKDATKARFRVAHVGDVIGAELQWSCLWFCEVAQRKAIAIVRLLLERGSN